MKCRACGNDHSPLVRCEIAAAINKIANDSVANEIANTKHLKFEGAPVNGPTRALTIPYPKYRDKDARRAYMRDYMRKRRNLDWN